MSSHLTLARVRGRTGFLSLSRTGTVSRVGKVQSSNGCRSTFIPAGSQLNVFQTDRFTVRDQNWPRVGQKNIASEDGAKVFFIFLDFNSSQPSEGVEKGFKMRR